jgi:phage tail-like protein
VLVSNFKAEPNPRGGRIDLSWINPIDTTFGGVKILRRETAFPGTGDPGEDKEIADLPVASQSAGALVKFVDANLKHETVYYYAAVPYDAAATRSLPSYASAMTTSPYRTAAHLYNNLPSLYRRYDTKLAPEIETLEPADRAKGQLQRFIDLFGLQFDLLRSFASGMDNFYDPRRVDGALLPLLASWIGADTNHALGFDKQRSEVQFAPHYFRTTGIAANLRGAVNRLVSWDAHVKEFVHNIFLATAPEQLTIWEKLKKEDVWQPAERISLDIAYEGRPAVLQTADRRQWLFHHARQSAPVSSNPAQGKATLDYWHIWYKLFERDEWLPAHHVSFVGSLNKYPTAIEDTDGRVWIFWTSYQLTGSQSIPEIRLALMAAGQPAREARTEQLTAPSLSLTATSLKSK